MQWTDPCVGGVIGRADSSLQAAFPCFAATAAAALRITSSTARGWESIGTWLLFTSTVVAGLPLSAQRLAAPEPKKTRLDSTHPRITHDRLFFLQKNKKQDTY